MLVLFQERAEEMQKDKIRSIWGLANSKELQLTKEELYAIIYRETDKDSIRALTTREKNRIIAILINMKEKHQMRPGMATGEQIWKIKKLEKELGWQDNPKRLEGFIRKYYKVERLEWLQFRQAVKLIESLKKLAVRNKNNEN